MYKIILASVAALTMTAGIAMAEMKFALGVIGNAAEFTTVGNEIEGVTEGGDGEITNATHSNDVDYPSIFVEYSGGEPGGMSIAVGFEYVPGDASIGAKTRTDTDEGDDNTGEADTGDYTAKAEVSDFTTFYVEPGYMFNENFTLYGKLGVSQLTVTSLESLANGTTSSTYGNATIVGGMYGVGIKASHGSGVFVKLEATVQEFETVSLASTTGNSNTVTADPEAESVRLALGFAF